MFAAFTLLVVVTILLTTTTTSAAPSGVLNHSVPLFSVTDTAGRSVTSKSLRGRATVLLVFCTCDACRQVADRWAMTQREPFFYSASRALASTLVVYAGDRDAAKAFARSVRFDPASTTVAADPTMSVARQMRAMPCPSVYVVDSAGVVRYSSKDLARPDEVSPSVLIGQTLNLLTALGGPSRVGAPASPAVVAPADVGPSLTPVREAGLEVIEDNGLAWHVDDPAGTRVARSFSFRNTARAPVDVQHVQASCGCGDVRLSKNGTSVTSTVVKPGETVRVSVSAEIGEGPVSKVVQVWLYSRSDTPVGWVKIVVTRR